MGLKYYSGQHDRIYNKMFIFLLVCKNEQK